MIFLSILLLSTLVHATVLQVPTEYETIQFAFDASQIGDTVLLERGTYFELLQAPDHTVSLFSNYFQSRDTTDILETILDGQLEGTILTLNASGNSQMVIDGFTFTRGMGSYYSGGAIQVSLNANLCLSNCFFHHNESNTNGDVIRCVVGETWGESDISIENVLLQNNNFAEYTPRKPITISTRGKVFAKGISFLPSEPGFSSGVSIHSIEDSVIVRDVFAHGVDQVLLVFDSDSNCVVSNVQMSNCRGRCKLIVRGGYVRADSIFADSVHFEDGGHVYLGGSNYLEASHVRINQCTSSLRESAGTPTYNLFRLSSSYQAVLGSLSDFVFTNNVIGDVENTLGQQSDTWSFATSCVSLYNGLIANNEMHIWPDPEIPDDDHHVVGPLFSAYFSTNEDTARIRNCVFRDNLLVDHDDYSNPSWQISPNRARSLYVSKGVSGGERYLEMDHLVFMNNRQPNHCPELHGENFYIGSDVTIDEMHSGAAWFSIHDIRMEGIDDGGIEIDTYATRAEVYNIWLKDVNRSGLEVRFKESCEETLLENAHIDGIVAQDMYIPHPYTHTGQRALIASSRNGYIPNGITVINCELPTLLYAIYGLRNSLIYGNDVVFFDPWAEDPEYSYMWTDFDLPGVGNQVGSDPFFDMELGAPFLASDSPCIDAGDPNSIFNDLEDPDNPGYALWPSQGGLRNDIGYTGGPRAALLDSQWVDLPRIDPEILLTKSFHLGKAYPNPFNPVTQIPFTLMHPADIELTIYDLLGRKMTTLVDGSVQAGAHLVPFHGGGLASGMYLAALMIDGRQVEVQKMLLVR
jgi:hypothetical protein